MMDDSQDLDFGKLIRVAQRRAPIVLLCSVLAAVAAFVLAKHQPKQYTGTASILFQNEQLQQEAAGLPGVVVEDPQSVTDTNVKLATLPGVIDATAAAVGTTPSEIQDGVSVSEVGDTDLLAVTATADTPAQAARIANAYAREAIAYREQSDRAYYASALRAVTLQFQALSPLQQASPQGLDLKSRIASLQTLAQLQGSELQLAQAATAPSSPSSPHVKVDTVVGGFLGLLLGLAIAFGLERFDRRLRDPSDLEQAYRVPLVGVVPESQALRSQGTGDERRALPAREAEVFALLRAHIRYFNVDRQLRVVVVVSAAPQDGKSTVARNLALAGARVGERVLFVEADLRRPSAAKVLGVAPLPGIAEILIEGMSLNEATQQASLAVTGEQPHSIDVLVAGGVLPPNPARVTESRAMETLLTEARERYDLVVVDTPPLTMLSDAFPLLRIADGVLIVSRLEQNHRDLAERLRVTLETSGAPMIGVVANGYRERAATSYAYGYAHSYELPTSAQDPISVGARNGSDPTGPSTHG